MKPTPDRKEGIEVLDRPVAHHWRAAGKAPKPRSGYGDIVKSKRLLHNANID
jgi:hypothetical protein